MTTSRSGAAPHCTLSDALNVNLMQALPLNTLLGQCRAMHTCLVARAPLRLVFCLLLWSSISGCATSGDHPLYATVEPSGKLEYPYRLTLHTNEVSNFNIHQLAFDHNESEREDSYVLKRDLGILRDGEFAMGWSKPDSQTIVRGTITLTKQTVVLSVEYRPSESDPKYHSIFRNVTYPIRSAGPTKSKP